MHKLTNFRHQYLRNYLKWLLLVERKNFLDFYLVYNRFCLQKLELAIFGQSQLSLLFF